MGGTEDFCRRVLSRGLDTCGVAGTIDALKLEPPRLRPSCLTTTTISSAKPSQRCRSEPIDMSPTNSPVPDDSIPDRMSVPFDTVIHEIHYPILPTTRTSRPTERRIPLSKRCSRSTDLCPVRRALWTTRMSIAKRSANEHGASCRCGLATPNGEVIRETPYREGKTTGNGLPLWGATLYDFYFVHRIPGMTGMLTITSGSMITKWMRLKGETYAMDYIDQAEKLEHEPKIMHPYHIGEFIELIEQQVHLKKTGRSLKVDKTVKEKVGLRLSWVLKADNNIHQIPDCLLPPSDYPGRWPLVPFSTPTCRLQERIPLDKLPKRLIVHDPWGCLSGTRRRAEEKEKWRTKPDAVYTYNLTRSGEKKGQVHVDESSLTDEASEAHLFINPKRRIGVGNHSFIYQAELELPRELVVKPKECATCSCDGVPLTKEQRGDRLLELFENQKATRALLRAPR